MSAPHRGLIAWVDTSTSAVTEIPTGDQSCPQGVAVVGDHIWFASADVVMSQQPDGCDISFEYIRDLDPATGDITSAVQTSAASYAAWIQPLAGTHQVLVADQHLSGGSTSLVDADTHTVVTQVQRDTPPVPPVVSPDGSSAFFPPLATYSLPGLDLLSLYDDSAWYGVPAYQEDIAGPNAANAGLVAVTSTLGRIFVVDRATQAVRNVIWIGPDIVPQPRRLAFVGSTLDIIGNSGDTGTTLYVEPTPTTAAPTLTVASTHAVVTKPTALSGSLTDQGAPAPGSTITVTDTRTGDVVGTTTTDQTGAWSFEHTWSTVGGRTLLVTAGATDGHKPAVTSASFHVDYIDSTITLSTPPSVAPGDVIHATGTVTTDGAPLSGGLVDWTFWCSSQHQDGTATTQADGSYAVDVTPGECTEPTLYVGWAGDETHLSVNTHHTIEVTWHVQKLTITLPSAPVYPGDPVHGTVALTQDGQPMAGRAVILTWQQGYFGTIQDISGTTGSDGTLPVDFTTTSAAHYIVQASVDGSADTLGDQAEASLDVAKATSHLTLDPGPRAITLDDPVTFTGTFSRADGTLDGAVVSWQGWDSAGIERSGSVTLAADGTFTFTDTPQHAGTTHYLVGYAGDVRYAAAQQQSADVTVYQRTPVLTVTPEHTTYDAGDEVTIHITLTNTDDRHIDVGTREPYAAEGEWLYQGLVPDDGLTLHYTAERDQVITTETIATPDTQHALTQTTVEVRPVVTARAVRPLEVSHGVAIYGTWAHPLFTTRVRPRPDVGCTQFGVQRRTAGGWRPVATFGCTTLDDQGRGSLRYTLSHTPGTTYRFRSAFGGDYHNAAAHSGWVRLRFRRQT